MYVWYNSALVFRAHFSRSDISTILRFLYELFCYWIYNMKMDSRVRPYDL